ncbi:GNAT family N-acetyltransferase [Helcobacillus massiliensis]|uniref:GNAT family N-acetyltransferase n=1 Tax=Helcobacillus massiliensis TaxID=521392 RepID=UPI0021A6DE6E|nr:GNAT family N-acetyltransferase [Helcobacillus massiliensis]MCT1556839.1 GNAT family N-acetyltransferase [Helcobacillus massiliensis]MCT2035663.1 GNAT family N-acetyltransferase [Helcobacillus massiliensis]MCT2330885.1 GNAT family N-acetyltransferase [Helcobacillus massiliensis]
MSIPEDHGPLYAVVTSDDREHLARLLASFPDYARRVGGLRADGTVDGDSAARDVLETLPPGVDASAKNLRGLWVSAPVGPSAAPSADPTAHTPAGLPGMGLIAVADVIRGWPTDSTAFIGILFVHGEQQGRGLGAAFHRRVEKEISRWDEIDRIELRIVATNADAAEPFWRRMGFEPTGETSPFERGEPGEAGHVSSTSARWAKDLPRR